MARRRRNRRNRNANIARAMATQMVSNSEIVSNVDTDTSGNHSFQIALNPAYFDWGKSILALYGRYRFRRVRLVFEPYVGTQSDGRVLCAWLPDPADANKWDTLPSASKLAAVTSAGTKVSTQAHRRAVMDVPVDMTWRYCESAHTETDAEERQEDSGHLVFLTLGGPVSKTIGSWYVDYQVEFANPQLAGIN